jgi:16S rRNA (uracil1498-N3)-methyltransferase
MPSNARLPSFHPSVARAKYADAMQHLFLPDSRIDVAGLTAVVEGQDHQHLAKVLRARSGDRVVVISASAGIWLAEISEVEKHCTQLRLLEVAEQLTAPEPPVHITVAQALGKGDKFEQVVQHGVEAGASAFVPLKTERTVAELPRDPARAAEKTARWNQIARSAAEQSHRRCVPRVAEPQKFAAFAAQEQHNTETRLILSPDGRPLHTVIHNREQPPARAVIAIGPEGGWSPQELQLAADNGWIAVGLGPRVLRTETAPLVALSQILYEFER